MIYQLWRDWSEINKPDCLVCYTPSRVNAENIKVALEKLMGMSNYYIKEIK